MNWLNLHLAYIRWAVILGGLAVTFWAGLHWANLTCKADKLDTTQATLDHTIDTGEKDHAVRKKVNALPVDGAALMLMQSWSRNSE